MGKPNRKQNKKKKQTKAKPANNSCTCPHFSSIDEEKIARTFQNKAFGKALSGKQISSAENKALSKVFPNVNWYHISEMYICLKCGQPIDKKHFDSHFQKEHCLALSCDDQTITCVECGDCFDVREGTFCGKLLGISNNVTPLSPEICSLKEKVEGARGLINYGNSCWMNATLQILIRLPNFIDNAHIGDVSQAFLNLKKELKQDGRAIRPNVFKDVLHQISDYFSVQDQHDAYEFLLLLLDSIRNEQEGISKGLNSKTIETVENSLNTQTDSIFAFITKTIMKCQNCGYQQFIFERVAVLSLFIPFGCGNATLENCIQLYFSESALNEKECSHCHEKCEYSYTPTLIEDHMPDIMIIHLARFRIGKNGYIKNNSNVECPMVLDFEETSGIDAKYNLLGFVIHTGSLTSGHYTAVFRIKNSFYLFDDEDVFAVKEEKVLQLQPYILFYQKIEDQ